MALLIPSGTTSVDLAVSGTYRQDISDLLLGPLYVDPSTLGTLQLGESFSGNSLVKNWNEESLNQSVVTDLTGAGQTSSSTSLLVSASDASVLDIGTVLADGTGNATVNGIAGSERVQVTGKGAISGGNVTITISRAMSGGPAATAHATNAKWYILGTPVPGNSDLGPDKTKPRVNHYNYGQRFRTDVNLAKEVLVSALSGFTPGIPNEMTKQLKNRLLEQRILLNRSVLYGVGGPGDGVSGSTSGNNATSWGLIPMLGGTGGAYNSTASVYNYANGGLNVNSWSPGQLMDAINDANGILFVNGVRSDYLYCSVLSAQSIAKTMSDNIRVTQDETTRGFSVKKLLLLLGNEVQIIIDPYLSNLNGYLDMLLIDSSRVRLCPYDGGFLDLITSPSFRHGDACSLVLTSTLEVRNTGSDTGQAHVYFSNVSV